MTRVRILAGTPRSWSIGLVGEQLAGEPRGVLDGFRETVEAVLQPLLLVALPRSSNNERGNSCG